MAREHLFLAAFLAAFFHPAPSEAAGPALPLIAIEKTDRFLVLPPAARP